MSNYLELMIQEKNISKTELSRRSGVNRTTISKLCANKYKSAMNTNTAYDLAIALGIPIGGVYERNKRRNGIYL